MARQSRPGLMRSERVKERVNRNQKLLKFHSSSLKLGEKRPRLGQKNQLNDKNVMIFEICRTAHVKCHHDHFFVEVDFGRHFFW